LPNRCHDDLAAAGVRFTVLADKRGVDDPVAVRSPLGGVIWRSWGDAPMVADCRLALTLVRLGPELLRAGITELHYSGAYSYRMSRVGRLSLHAYGLAVDVHAVTADGVTFNVERDWVRNATAANCGALPGANRLLCVARRAGVFRELLGPENDADHLDHVHLGLAPLQPVPTPEVPRTPASFGAKDGTHAGVVDARSGQKAREKPEKSARLKRHESGRPSAAAKPGAAAKPKASAPATPATKPEAKPRDPKPRDPKRLRPEPREPERPQPKR
jgi:hypothetical protein